MNQEDFLLDDMKKDLMSMSRKELVDIILSAHDSFTQMLHTIEVLKEENKSIKGYNRGYYRSIGGVTLCTR